MLRVKFDYLTDMWSVQQDTLRLNVFGYGFYWPNRADLVNLLQSHGYKVDNFGHVR